jgi:hypothetical protein
MRTLKIQLVIYTIISFLLSSCTIYPRSEFLVSNTLIKEVIVEISYDDGNVRRYVAPPGSKTLIYANHRYEGSIQVTFLVGGHQIGTWSNYFAASRPMRCHIDIPLKNAVDCDSKFPIGFSLV